MAGVPGAGVVPLAGDAAAVPGLAGDAGFAGDAVFPGVAAGEAFFFCKLDKILLEFVYLLWIFAEAGIWK